MERATDDAYFHNNSFSELFVLRLSLLGLRLCHFHSIHAQVISTAPSHSAYAEIN